jgi:hypothetical protein
MFKILCKTYFRSLVWWLTLVILAFRRLRQKDGEFEIILDYRTSSWPV